MLTGAVLPLVASLGAAPASDWARAVPASGNGFVAGYREDLAALAAVGVGAVRVPFDWSRWEPADGRVDRDVVEWYGHVLDAAADAGVGVWACLWEGPLPGWFADAGGWGDERAAGRHWPRFVDRVAETWGDRLAGWVPMDRPVQRAEAGWLTGRRPPRRADPERYPSVVRTVLVAWRDAWRVVLGGPPVATALGLERVVPTDEGPDARAEAHRREEVRFEVWPRALRDGVVDAPGLAVRDVGDLAGAADILGVVVDFDDSVPVDTEATDAAVERWVQQSGDLLRRAVDGAPPMPAAVTLRLRRADGDGREAGVKGLARIVREAGRDGIDVVAAWVEPGVDGLLSSDREPTAASTALATSLA